MGEDSRTLICPKDREMILASLVDEMHHRIEQLGVPGVDDCLTLLSMFDKLTFTKDGEINRPLCHSVMPLLKDGLGRLVERFCALEPGETNSECLSDAIQDYAKAISLIANWQYVPEAAAAAPELEAPPPPDAVPCAEEAMPVEAPCCAEAVAPVEQPCVAEEAKPCAEPCAEPAPCMAAPSVEQPCTAEPVAAAPVTAEPCEEQKPAEVPYWATVRPER